MVSIDFGPSIVLLSLPNTITRLSEGIVEPNGAQVFNRQTITEMTGIKSGIENLAVSVTRVIIQVQVIHTGG